MLSCQTHKYSNTEQFSGYMILYLHFCLYVFWWLILTQIQTIQANNILGFFTLVILVINIVSCKKPHKIEEKHHIFNAGWQKKWNSGWETLIFKLQFAVHIWPSHPNQHRVQILFCCAARDHCTMAVVKRWHFRERTVGISAVMCRTHLGRCSNNCS